MVRGRETRAQREKPRLRLNRGAPPRPPATRSAGRDNRVFRGEPPFRKCLHAWWRPRSSNVLACQSRNARKHRKNKGFPRFLSPVQTAVFCRFLPASGVTDTRLTPGRVIPAARPSAPGRPRRCCGIHRSSKTPAVSSPAAAEVTPPASPALSSAPPAQLPRWRNHLCR
jgi:hypothetical protein